MAAETDKTPFEQILDLLAEQGVEFIVIGGQAAVLHGVPIPTFDTDLCYRRDKENLRRLAEVLKKLQVSLRTPQGSVPFVADARALEMGSNFTFNTAIGEKLDILGYVEPFGGYEQIVARAETYIVAGHSVKTISLDDLIRIKQHILRDKDRAVLVQLRAIKQIRERQAP